MRREALDKAGPFDVCLRSAVDHDLWLRVALSRPGNVYCIPQVLTFYRMRKGQITKDWPRMEQSWRMLMTKMRGLAPVEVRAVEVLARSNLYRYLAYIAYENEQYSEAASLLCIALNSGFRHLLRDRRMWLLATSLIAWAVLPAKTHRKLDSLARKCRSHRTLPPKIADEMRRTEAAFDA
jgi:hypothetical protein